jgi:hypothetical protein
LDQRGEEVPSAFETALTAGNLNAIRACPKSDIIMPCSAVIANSWKPELAVTLSRFTEEMTRPMQGSARQRGR